ncbi:MAG: hypothetical protein ACTS2F_30970 [Thainema sp.]
MLVTSCDRTTDVSLLFGTADPQDLNVQMGDPLEAGQLFTDRLLGINPLFRLLDIRLEVSHIHSFPVSFWFVGHVEKHLNLSPFCI